MFIKIKPCLNPNKTWLLHHHIYPFLESHKMSVQNTNIKQTTDTVDSWFDDFIASLQGHQLQHQTNTLNEKDSEFYNFMANASMEDLLRVNREHGHAFFVKKMIVNFIESLGDTDLKSLAFDLDDNQVLVWATIQDNDEASENKLILSKSKTNAEFIKDRLSIDIMITEESDNFPIPSQYKILKAA